MLYELATHPDDIQKLRREILATVGPVEAPTYEDLKNMRFLQCVINEGMRLYPGGKSPTVLSIFTVHAGAEIEQSGLILDMH